MTVSSAPSAHKNHTAGLTAAAFAAALIAAPNLAQACACGCGVFDVGAATMMPTDSDSGFSTWFRYSYMDQNRNWEGDHKAPAADNDDKKLTTSFYTVGGQYMINRSWTVMAELPTYDRSFRTTDDDGSVFGHAGSPYRAHITDIGDLMLVATFTGLSQDMSTGLSFGLKLPTGASSSPTGPSGGGEFDRDSLPGTGSTDLIVGAYHVGRLNRSGALSYFVQGRYQAAVATRDGYRPGDEFDGAVGVTYNFGAVGPFAKVAPVLQVLNSYRERDSGVNSDAPNSGYERVLVAPGIDLRLTKKVRLFADIAVPLYQHVNAERSPAIEGTSGQLVAPQLFKIQIGYDF